MLQRSRPSPPHCRDQRPSGLLRPPTASETGNAGVRVQRLVGGADDVSVSDPSEPLRQSGSTGEGDWQTVGSVAGAGTTTEVRSYTFTDEGVPYDADSLTYRLNQIDTDDSTSYSDPVAVARGAVEQVRLPGTYPNPARSRATVRLAIPAGSSQKVTLRLYGVLERQVRTVRSSAEAGRHTLQLDTGELASGTYFLRLVPGSATLTERMTVVR